MGRPLQRVPCPRSDTTGASESTRRQKSPRNYDVCWPTSRGILCEICFFRYVRTTRESGAPQRHQVQTGRSAAAWRSFQSSAECTRIFTSPLDRVLGLLTCGGSRFDTTPEGHVTTEVAKPFVDPAGVGERDLRFCARLFASRPPVADPATARRATRQRHSQPPHRAMQSAVEYRDFVPRENVCIAMRKRLKDSALRINW